MVSSIPHMTGDFMKFSIPKATAPKANQISTLKQGSEKPVLENSPKLENLNTREDMARDGEDKIPFF